MCRLSGLWISKQYNRFQSKKDSSLTTIAICFPNNGFSHDMAKYFHCYARNEQNQQKKYYFTVSLFFLAITVFLLLQIGRSNDKFVVEVEFDCKILIIAIAIKSGGHAYELCQSG